MATGEVINQDEPSREIQLRVPESVELAMAPRKVLQQAVEAATALSEVLRAKKKPVMFNGEQYLELEDWQTLGRFYGYTSSVESTRYIEFGSVHGFEASAVLLDREGNIRSRAEAMCLNDEDNWGMRAKYEYVNNRRVKVGEVPTPLFQLRSMAQTRAQSKVWSNVLRFVPVLAGFQGAPAEEMTGEEPRAEANGKVTPMPQRKSAAQPESPKPTAVPERRAENVTPPTAGKPAITPKPCPECGDPLSEDGCHYCGWVPDQPTMDAPAPRPSGVQQTRQPNPAAKPPAPRTSGRKVSDGQAKRFYAIAMGNGITKQEQKEYLRTEFGIDSDRDLEVGEMYDKAIAWAGGQ